MQTTAQTNSGAGDLVSGEITCNCGFDPDKHDGHSLRCAVRTAREVPQPAEAPIDTGGPAFPWGEHGTHLGGMSIRDYFAAKAMAAIVSTRDIENSDGFYQEALVAENAYAMADAMLKARANN